MELNVQAIDAAFNVVKSVARKTPLQLSKRLSREFNATVYIKREDLQEVRSYKIRGAYNLMSSLTKEERKKGVVCASAGNHAQGVAYSASQLGIKATVYMPVVTPLQKINRVKSFGGDFVTVRLEGGNFDESQAAARLFCEEKKSVFVHPFNDERVIAGQGTVGKEIYDELGTEIDFVLVPIGGGGLIAGVSTYLKFKSKQIKIIGVEPTGASSMAKSIKADKVITLDTIDTFVDGVAVKTVGDKTFKICKKNVDDVLIVPEGKVCSTMIELYQNEGVVAEPAGALSIAALEGFKEKIKGKKVVCILSGGNNDILRYPEIMEKSLVYQGRKHYFLINFAQKPGQLRNFVDSALGPNDDIVRFEYIKKTSKEMGPALIGIELTDKKDYEPLIKRMKQIGLDFSVITASDLLYHYLV